MHPKEDQSEQLEMDQGFGNRTDQEIPSAMRMAMPLPPRSLSLTSREQVVFRVQREHIGKWWSTIYMNMITSSLTQKKSTKVKHKNTCFLSLIIVLAETTVKLHVEQCLKYRYTNLQKYQWIYRYQYWFYLMELIEIHSKT